MKCIVKSLMKRWIKKHESLTKYMINQCFRHSYFSTMGPPCMNLENICKEIVGVRIRNWKFQKINWPHCENQRCFRGCLEFCMLYKLFSITERECNRLTLAECTEVGFTGFSSSFLPDNMEQSRFFFNQLKNFLLVAGL